MKRIVRPLLAYLALTAFAAPCAQAQNACPNPRDMLNISMGQAKQQMDRFFGKGWGYNDIGCSNQYANLMSDPQRSTCQIGGVPIKRFIAFGFEGGSLQIGMMYLVSTEGRTDADPRFTPDWLGLHGLIPIDTPPETLRQMSPENIVASRYASPANDLYVEIRPNRDHNEVELAVFDLVQVRRQKTAIEACAREARTWRDAP